MTSDRRTTLGICLIVGVSFVVGASLTLMLAPMLEALSLDDDDAQTALVLPAIGSLLVVFVAGHMGDRWGHRRVIIGAGAIFVAGSALVLAGASMPMIASGLLLAGAAATAIQIVALGLLQVTFPHGPARISAFTSFGMVYPAVYLIVPTVTGLGLQGLPWRAVPCAWALLGLAIPVLALALLRPPGPRQPFGEPWTLILAGVALAGIARALDQARNDGWLSPSTLAAACAALVALLACVALVRRLPAPSLSSAPLRNAATVLLLASVLVIALADTLMYITVALEYVYDLSPLEAALVLVPAEAAGVLGSKVLAAQLMRRLGGPRAGSVAIAGFTGSLLLLVLARTGSPAWVVVVGAAAFSAMGGAAITVVNAEVMSMAPPGANGMLSAYRGAASALGSAISVLAIGTGILGVAKLSAGPGRMTTEEVDSVMAGIRAEGWISALLVLAGWGAYEAARRRSGWAILDSNQ